VLDSPMERLLEVLEEAIPDVVQRGATTICTEIPAYARIADDKLVADVGETLSRNLHLLLEVLRSGAPVTHEQLGFIRAPTTRRLRMRLPLADYLHAYRIGHRIIWDTIASCAEDEGSRDAAFEFVGPMMEFVNTISTHVAEVWVEVEQLLVAEGERVRRDVLEELLTGARPTRGPRTEALRAAGLADGSSYVVITALPATPPNDEHLLRVAAMALGGVGKGAPSPLAVPRGDEIVAVVPLEHDQRHAVAQRLRAARTEVAELGVELAIGASTVVTGFDHMQAAYREATDARTLSGAATFLCLCELSAFEYLALRGDETAERLISPPVAEFVRSDLADGGALTTTLLAYAAADLNAKAAAERLHIHVNTAHYRLTRIAERTGADLRSLQAVIEILIAIKLAHGRASGPV
jgi:hypothetical protein